MSKLLITVALLAVSTIAAARGCPPEAPYSCRPDYITGKMRCGCGV